MPNCDQRDRFVDQYLKLMMDSFLAHLWVPTLDFIHIYLKYFTFTSAILILTSFLAHLSQRLICELIVYPCSGVCHRRRRCRRPPFSNVFSSETAWPIKAKFYVEPPLEGGTKVCINGPGHMTKMAAMPIYGKNL